MSEQVIFRNKGLIDLKGVTTFGVSVKEGENPIGYFGTGLKYAIAICLREGCEVVIWRGKEKHVFTTHKGEMRGKEFDWVYMDGKELAFTTELGKDWPLWAAYRELYCNTYDEPGASVGTVATRLGEGGWTTIVVRGKAFKEVYDIRGTIILETKALYKLPGLEIHEGENVGQYLFYKGIRVQELPKPAMYNYNLTNRISLTENRTLADHYDIHKALSRGVTKSKFMGLIRRILEAGEGYFESTIDYTWQFNKPGHTFNEVVKVYIGSGHSGYNVSAHTLYDNHISTPKNLKEIPRKHVKTEWLKNLEGALRFWKDLRINITDLPIRITDDLKSGVLTDVVDGVIYVSMALLQKGPRKIATALYLEYARMRYSPDNKQFAMQDFIIDQMIDLGELLRGKPLTGANDG